MNKIKAILSIFIFPLAILAIHAILLIKQIVEWNWKWHWHLYKATIANYWLNGYDITHDNRVMDKEGKQLYPVK